MAFFLGLRGIFPGLFTEDLFTWKKGFFPGTFFPRTAQVRIGESSTARQILRLCWMLIQIPWSLLRARCEFVRHNTGEMRFKIFYSWVSLNVFQVWFCKCNGEPQPDDALQGSTVFHVLIFVVQLFLSRRIRWFSVSALLFCFAACRRGIP